MLLKDFVGHNVCLRIHMEEFSNAKYCVIYKLSTSMKSRWRYSQKNCNERYDSRWHLLTYLSEFHHINGWTDLFHFSSVKFECKYTQKRNFKLINTFCYSSKKFFMCNLTLMNVKHLKKNSKDKFFYFSIIYWLYSFKNTNMILILMKSPLLQLDSANIHKIAE